MRAACITRSLLGLLTMSFVTWENAGAQNGNTLCLARWGMRWYSMGLPCRR